MNKIFDLHNDYYLKLKTDAKRESYIKRNNAYLNNLVTAVWTSELDSEKSLISISEARDFVNKHDNLLLGVEDLHFLSKDNLDKFLALKPLYAGLAWNNSNCIAGGALESGGITPFGKNVIKSLSQNNIYVDTAHLNEESFIDVIKLTTKPVICSHSACFGVNSHARNLKDYQIKMLIDSGGIFGLCLVSDFLDGTAHTSVNTILKHIDYFACKFGIDNLALGTDFNGTKHLPSGVFNYNNLICKLKIKLLDFGYTEKALNKIFYENAENFFFNLNNL